MEMDKMESVLNGQREEYQRYLGVMKENFSSKLQLIGEQYHTLTEKIGLIAEDMQIVKTDADFLKSALRK